MGSNLFYSRGNNENIPENSKRNNCSFKKKKENTLTSLCEVEYFLHNYINFTRSVKLYKWFRN